MTTKPQLSEYEKRMAKAIEAIFKHTYLKDFFFEEGMRKIRFRPDEMRWRIQGFSHSEQVLVRVGLDMWSGSGDAKIWEILEVLDDNNFHATLSGLAIIKTDRQWPY